MKDKNKIAQEIQDLDLVKDVKKKVSKLSDQFVESYDNLSDKRKSMVGMGWVLGAGIVLGAIYCMTGGRNSKKLKDINNKKIS